jgi:dihydropyrimidinase
MSATGDGFDWVIHGGEVFTDGTLQRCDIGISEGRVAAIAPSIAGGRQRFDARGRWLLPGGVDAHVHIDQPPNPGSAARGAEMADNFESGTRSAAFGGTTTVLSFAPQFKGQTLQAALDEYHTRARGNAYVDHGVHMIVSDPTPEVLEQEIPALQSKGCTSVKIYLTYEALRLSDRQVLDVLDACRSAGLLTMVHAENLDCILWLTERLERAGMTAPQYHEASRPMLVEREATYRAIALAELVETPILIVHVGASEAIEVIAQARQRGLPIHAETCPQYLFLSTDDLHGAEGAKCMCSPPPRAKENAPFVWAGLAERSLSLVSSDHAPYRFDESGKLKYGPRASFKFIANGIPGLETRMPLMFSEGVMAGRFSLADFVELCCTTPAQLYGLYPRKGQIAVGADADLVAWDPQRKVMLSNALLHHNVDYTPYAGMEITGWPMQVWVRGTLTCDDGRLVVERGGGRYLQRERSAVVPSPDALPVRRWVP